MISVVIPAYNSAGFIGEALNSVAEQTYLQSGQDEREGVEVIVVDDASTDHTVEVVKTFCSASAFTAQLSGVSLLQQRTNSGPAAARNRGIAEAKGEKIAFLDADDRWLPGKLEIQLRMISERPEVCLWCGEVMGAGSARTLKELSLEDFLTENPVATSTVVVRRDALECAKGFDEQFRGAEDYDLWIRLIGRCGCHAAKLSEELVIYRSESGSLSMDDRKFLPDALSVLKKAFGDDGVFNRMRDMESLAVANQYWNASWMAFNRGARGDAIRLWRKGHSLGGRTLKRAWYRLLIRYLIGRTTNEEHT